MPDTERRRTDRRADASDARLTRLETIVDSLASGVNALTNDVRELTRNVSHHFTRAGRTNWPVVISGLAVVVSVQLAMNRATIAPLESQVSAMAGRDDRMHARLECAEERQYAAATELAYLRGRLDAAASSGHGAAP